MMEIISSLPNKLQNDYMGIWKEYTDHTSLESKFVHQLDKLEMLLQAKIYEDHVGYEKIKPFFRGNFSKITFTKFRGDMTINRFLCLIKRV